jgi:hypothetical protein
VSMRGSSAFSFIQSALITIMVCFTLSRALAEGQASPVTAIPSPLISRPVDETQLTRLAGNTHPLARPQFDLGTAPATLPLQRMLLVLKRSAAQEAALRRLLDEQQDQASPNYHKWLTPETFGEQFGPTDIDMQTITSWLQSRGFQVGSTKGRTVLEFSGTAGQVQEAFHTSIHKYLVNGEQNWANASDPMIPTALTPAVAGIASLNNFPRKAMNVSGGRFTRDKKTGRIHSAQPQITFPGGCVENNLDNGSCAYGLTPYDFATIYNVLPLWNAGIDGTGVTIAIVGETDIQLSDVEAFRSFFGLPVNDPTFILNGPDPGIQGDESEADIDVQWSGGVAKGATIDFVISQSTETTSGTDLSAVYIVDQNLAPILSESYGECELGLGTAGNQFYNTLWQQASAQGITVFISAGDAGSAGCDNFDAQSPAPARYGLQVSGYASTPYNVAVGGTDFNDFSNPATYWSPNNNPTTQESALSYIPETTWNDSCTNGLFASIGYSSNAETNCNNSRLTPYFDVPLGGSGGVSACTTPSGSTPGSCAGGYIKPTWQMGTGVPADGKRDIPDVSLFASNGFVGQAYLICQADQNGDCPSSFLGFGGTSVSSPAFAGIMALINQKTGERQGNANYVFYQLAAKAGASCTSGASEASSCIFNDVTAGTNAGPCTPTSQNCVTNNAGDAYGVLSGYNAGTGYDLATGLGSVNANNLVNAWASVSSLPSTTTISGVTPTTITHGQALNFTVTVKPQSGSGTPTGEISLMGPTTINSTSQGIAGFNLSNGTATGSTELLPGGTYSLTAHYPGDANYGASDSAGISVTVGKENSQPQIFLVTFAANGNILSGNTNAAVYGSPYILRVNVENAAGQVCAPAAPSGSTECPSGKVSLTNNGSRLDAGAYQLNSSGYFEDQAVQLPGGTDSVKAGYAGDNSFKGSTVTTPISITPASTNISTPSVQSFSVGVPFSANVTIQAQSSGAAPTGTVSFLVNGTAVPGSVSYSGATGSGSSPTATLSAFFTSAASAFPRSGSYSITASYSGDANYGPSTSAAATATVQYPSPLLTTGPPQITVAAGGSVTVSAIVDTQLKNVPVPTGTVPFIYWGPMTPVVGTETYSATTDSNGNVALQASLTFTPTADVNIASSYNGDSNYPSASGGGLANVVVTGSDFALIPMSSSITLSPGQQGQILMYVYGQSSFNGTVNFSCSGLPSGSACSFSPASLTTPNYTNLAVTTTAPSTMKSGLEGRPRPQLWVFGLGAPLAVLLLGGGARRGKVGALVLCFAVAILFIGSSCGGGGGGGGVGGGGGGNPGTPLGTYPITITAVSGSGTSAITHTITFNLVVQ